MAKYVNKANGVLKHKFSFFKIHKKIVDVVRVGCGSVWTRR
jgi:hypothetical protein